MAKLTIVLAILSLVSGLAGCASRTPLVKAGAPRSYTELGKTYYPMAEVSPGYSQAGTASWYGPGFHGRKTATGEVYDMNGLTAAHTALPLNSVVRVTNLMNNKEVTVRINDRGPFVGDRVIDLSLASAKELGMVGPGTAPVRVTVVKGGEVKLAKNAGPVKPNAPKFSPNPYYTGKSFTLLALRRG
jgi:rare lipoprotein A